MLACVSQVMHDSTRTILKVIYNTYLAIRTAYIHMILILEMLTVTMVAVYGTVV